MNGQVRLVAEIINETGEVTQRKELHTQPIVKPSDLLELGYRHEIQIQVLQHLQNILLKEQSSFLHEDFDCCPQCGANVIRKGHTYSDFHSVFTDHKIGIRRHYCSKCSWKNIPSVLSLFGTTMHPDLTKLQCEQAANQSYRQASVTLSQLSCATRKVNNHDRVKQTSELVGDYVAKNPVSFSSSPAASELCLQIDGGHVKSKTPNERSFEVLTSVVFDPDDIDYSLGYEKIEDDNLQIKYKRGKVVSKQCAASALNDDQASIKSLTLEAAKKQGLTDNTHVIAICDGAENCWQVVDIIEAHSQRVTRILDWFHLAMRFQNLSLKDSTIKEKAKHAKWYLWRGKIADALSCLQEVLNDLDAKKEKEKIEKLISYIKNNESAIVDYELRHKQGLCFTSQLAESNVESLINQRCKRQQHMRWSRQGLHALLQIRAMIASNDWCYHWEEIVCSATLKRAA